MESFEFRAWYMVQGFMLSWQQILDDMNGRHSPLITDVAYHTSFPIMQSNPLFEVMLYTGANDAAGKHIYRLDILRQGKLLYLVSWYPDRLQWWAQGLGTAPDKPLYELSEQNDIFVVGNGHENPELIKQLNI